MDEIIILRRANYAFIGSSFFSLTEMNNKNPEPRWCNAAELIYTERYPEKDKTVYK